jgi:peptidoglycan hydrolase CwlO-like protein
MRPVVRQFALISAALLTSTLLGGVAPARADEVATAQARVDKLQGLVQQTAVKLTAGTRAYERDQAGLRAANRELARSERRIDGVRAEAAAGATKLDAMARQMYMSPGNASVQIAVTQGPDAVLDALQMNNAVAHVAGNQSEIVRRAVAARVRLQTEQQRIQHLTNEARTLTERSAARLKQLNALADSTAARLSSAQDALAQARARAEARARARAAAAARAARARAVVVTGALCTGRSTAGQANGNLDPSSLCPLWRAPGHKLRADAAGAFNAMSRARAAASGGPLCVSDSYRSYSEQVSVYHRKPGLAAVPGTSNHGWGLAVDLCGGVERFGSEAYGWMQANAGRFGFFHPEWAQQGGSKPEAWHWEFNG